MLGRAEKGLHFFYLVRLGFYGSREVDGVLLIFTSSRWVWAA